MRKQSLALPDENAIKRAIIQYLLYRGALVLRVNSGAAMGQYHDKQGRAKQRFLRFSQWYASGISFKEGQTGVSDILAIIDKVLIAIETKAPNRKDEVTEAQRRFLDEVERRGGLAIVASSVADVEAALRGVG